MPFVNNYSPVQSFKDKEMCITVTTKKKKKIWHSGTDQVFDIEVLT